METLPTIILFRILSSLPAKDVSRFKQLHSTFKSLIKLYRSNLNYPSIKVEIFECEKNQLNLTNNVHVVVNNKWECTVHSLFAGTTELRIVRSCCTDHEGLSKAKSDSSVHEIEFFEPFVNKVDGYRSFFDALFEEANVEELVLNDVEDSLCIHGLIESIQGSQCKIDFISAAPSKNSFLGISELFQSVYLCPRRKKRDNPTLHILLQRSFTSNANLQSLNKLASEIDDLQIQISNDKTMYIIHRIAMNWREDPFPVFNFNLYATALLATLFPLWCTAELKKYFHVSKNDEEKNVKVIMLKDLLSGHEIQFTQSRFNDYFNVDINVYWKTSSSTPPSVTPCPVS